MAVTLALSMHAYREPVRGFHARRGRRDGAEYAEVFRDTRLFSSYRLCGLLRRLCVLCESRK